MAADEFNSGQTCGTCVFSRALNIAKLDGPMLCRRYPPVAVPATNPQGHLFSPGAIWPLVERDTPCCGEHRLKPSLLS